MTISDKDIAAVRAVKAKKCRRHAEVQPCAECYALAEGQRDQHDYRVTRRIHVAYLKRMELEAVPV